jgi:hypothetical protein
MSIEVKTVDVVNSAENQTIRIYQRFGWNFKSSQRIYNKNTSLEDRDGDLYAVTETVNYTKLVFERDTNMNNYQRLRELEIKYHGLNRSLPDTPPLYSSDVTMDEWGRSAKPDVSGALGRVLTILATIPVFVGGLLMANPNMDGETLSEIIDGVGKGESFAIYAVLAVAGGVIGLLLSKVLSKFIFRPFTLNKALKGHPCKERDRLERQYKVVHDQAVEYEGKLRRIEEILDEAGTLCE